MPKGNKNAVGRPLVSHEEKMVVLGYRAKQSIKDLIPVAAKELNKTATQWCEEAYLEKLKRQGYKLSIKKEMGIEESKKQPNVPLS